MFSLFFPAHTHTHTHTKMKLVDTEGGIHWGSSTDISTVPCVRQTASGKLFWEPAVAQGSVVLSKGGRGMCIHVAISRLLYCRSQIQHCKAIFLQLKIIFKEEDEGIYKSYAIFLGHLDKIRWGPSITTSICKDNPVSGYMLFECSVAQPCLTLCDPLDCSPPGSSVHGILQARILEWVAMLSSRGSSRHKDQTRVFHVSWIAGRFFTHWATWQAPSLYVT